MLSPAASNPLQCGFLNRKTMTEPSGKRSKDRTWQTFWCQAKDGNMEFYKVQGVHVKGNLEPPPRDIYPPPNRQQHKVGFAVLEGAWVEVDLTSQKNKDLDKRRKFLFQVILSNDVEYLFQAPSQNQMFQWVTQLKRAAWKGDGATFDPADTSRIKTSRCSLNKKSKHNTNSVRTTAADPIGIEEEGADFSTVLLRELDPRLPLLRKRLQSKRELLKQLQKIISSFHGNLEPLYRESDSSTTRRGHHHSNSITIPGGGEREGSHRRSGTSESINSDGGHVLTTKLLKDYYLLPGVEWAVLKEGETVEVLGRLANGWYRCKAQRDARFHLDTIPSIADATEQKMDDMEKMEEAGMTNVLHHIEEDEREKDLGQEPFMSLDFLPPEVLESSTVVENGVNGVRQDGLDNVHKEEEEELRDRKQRDDEKDVDLSEDEDKMNEEVDEPDSIDLSIAEETLSREHEAKDDDEEEYHAEDEAEEEAPKDSIPEGSFRQRTSSYMQATLINPVVKMRHVSLGRKESYNLATSQGSVDIMGVKETRHLSLFDPAYVNPAPSPMELKKLRISTLIEHERANESYIFPLVGAIPPSVLQVFAEADHTHARLTSSTSDYSSVTTVTDDSSSVHTHASSSDVSTIAETPSATFEPSVLAGKEPQNSSTTPSNLSNHESPTRSEAGSGEDPVDIEITYSTPVDERERLFSESFTASSSVTTLPSSAQGQGPLLTPPTSRKSARHLRSSSLPPPNLGSAQSHNSTTSVSQVTSPDLSLTDEDSDVTHVLEVRSPTRNGTLRVIPSTPTSSNQGFFSSSERRLSDGEAGKSPRRNKESRLSEKQRHSLDDTKSSKGLLHRFKKNILGKKSHPNPVGTKDTYFPSPSRSPTIPPRASAIKKLQDEESVPVMRSRVASISGRAMHSKGMGLVFGESSSDSESEEGHTHSQSSGSGGSPPSSKESSPVVKRRLNIEEEGVPKSPSPDTIRHSAVVKTMSTPLNIIRAQHGSRIGSDSTIDDERRTRRLALSISGGRKSRRSSLIETNITRYIKAPPRGVKRSICVVPENNKYGFHLEAYLLNVDGKKFPQTIVRHIVPGSPAFVAGLFPGDCILEVNGKDTHHSHVTEVVSLVQNSTSHRGRVDLVVAFVDGVSRLDLLKKSEEVRTGLRQRQTKLDQLIKQEREQCPTPSLSPTPSPTHIPSHSLSLWSEVTPSTGEIPTSLYPYSARLNSLLAIHHGDVTSVLCDLLVIPVMGSAMSHDSSTDCISNLLRAGGRELMDEISLADHCGLGKNLFTDGYSLTVQAICHCVFGQSEDHLISCCRSALEEAYEQDYKTILFWLDGFIAAGVSPIVIIETVRCWLEEGENSQFVDVIIFSMPQSPDLNQLMETCFPLRERELKDQALGMEKDDGDSDGVKSNSRTVIPVETGSSTSPSLISAIERQEPQLANPAGGDHLSPRKKATTGSNLMASESSGSNGYTAQTVTSTHESVTVTAERTKSSSSQVTAVSNSNASLAWETITEPEKGGSVQEKLSEFEAIIANISSHLSSPRRNH